MMAVLGLLFVVAADPTYCLDLRGMADVNPLDPAQVGAGPGYAMPPQYLWMEAEDGSAMSDEFALEDAAAASGGAIVGGAFGEHAGDWIEFAFDLPWNAKEGYVYLRTARTSDNALTRLQVSVNGDVRGSALVPINEGRGDEPIHFVHGLCSTKVGALRMGRQVLRIETLQDGEPLAIDGVWVTASLLSVNNRVGDDGVMVPPYLPGSMVYQPGLTQLRGAPYDLIDPYENEGKSVINIAPGRTALPADGGTMSQVTVLATSPGSGADATLVVGYSDGREEKHALHFGPLHAKRSQSAAIALGRYRYAYLAEADLKGGAVKSLAIETDQRILLLAVSFQP